MIQVKVSGSTARVESFFQRMSKRQQFEVLRKYGAIGVAALQRATPADKAETAHSWNYEISQRPGYFAIHWNNSHLDNAGRTPIAVLIQYGHATGTGGYVQGRDYINPALRPIFDQIAADMWKEVTR
jgi:hypothetical protein